MPCHTQRIAGPLESLTINTCTYAGIFKLHALVGRVKNYGRNIYWPRLTKRILDPLIRNRTSGEPVKDDDYGSSGEAGNTNEDQDN